jgi:hypothetical protein
VSTRIEVRRHQGSRGDLPWICRGGEGGAEEVVSSRGSSEPARIGRIQTGSRGGGGGWGGESGGGRGAGTGRGQCGWLGGGRREEVISG